MAVDVNQLYRDHGPMVLRRCRRMLGNEEAAVDAMHDVFVNVLMHRTRLDDRAPASLLFRIATNVCLNKIRSAGRRPEVPDGELIERLASAADAEARTLARRMLDSLFGDAPESSAAIATLHLLDGRTLQEVADETGMSVSGVRKRLRSLRARLHELEEV